jgi:pimeloyl-ACP methyl ester carboxylesterase
MNSSELKPPDLPEGIRSRMVKNHNGLDVHVLEAGYESAGLPSLLLLHGFPELSYSWRKALLPLASAGFHVIAPDQRGYGRTTGWDGDYGLDPTSFRTHNLARDALGLVYAMGYRQVAAVIGHDVGAFVAGYCALVRPDVFRRMALLSVPFEGAPALPFDTVSQRSEYSPAIQDINAELAALPRPRKDSMRYFASREADTDMLHCKQGLHDFFRAYYHFKSADWEQNKPHPLASFSASELAKIPTYYIMNSDEGMAETVAKEMPSKQEIAACRWLSEDELAFYTQEFMRTTFKGNVQWFRSLTDATSRTELELFSGRTIDVPSCFISGKSDWAAYRKPGAVDRMRTTCTQMNHFDLVEGAGHWPQQEQPERVNDLLLTFLKDTHALANYAT